MQSVIKSFKEQLARAALHGITYHLSKTGLNAKAEIATGAAIVVVEVLTAAGPLYFEVKVVHKV